MDVTRVSSGAIAMTVSLDELSAIRQYLNEVCHGYRVPAFETRIGASKDMVARLLDQTGRGNPAKVVKIDDDNYRVTFTPDEARILISAMTETLTGGGIADYEYAARIGFTVDETKELRSTLQAALSR